MGKEEMIESVRSYLSSFGKVGENEKNILKAMREIDRSRFINSGAYLDTALPIGEGQTISQPSTVARMLQLLDLKKGDKVLEIGSGSGWNASLVGVLVFVTCYFFFL